MRLSDFDYDLPPERIAQFPSADRTSSQLLFSTGDSADLQTAPFSFLEELVAPEDLIIVNDTRVIPARLEVHKPSGGKVEILLERLLNEREALVQLRANKSVKDGQRLVAEAFSCVVLGRQDRFFQVRFNSSAADIFHNHASIPLPPYIKRGVKDEDQERYQTVYSKEDGAVAAPTAGLHFDEELIERLRSSGIGWESITLHVGAGTFLPVQVDNIDHHKMHSETVEVSEETCQRVRQTKHRGGRIWAIGTTVVRALETAAENGVLSPYCGETSIFITPGFEFKVVDRLITNFHLPKSTLLMLVSAFAGYDTIKQYYQYAIDHELRFFSYGDAMMLTREDIK